MMLNNSHLQKELDFNMTRSKIEFSGENMQWDSLENDTMRNALVLEWLLNFLKKVGIFLKWTKYSRFYHHLGLHWMLWTLNSLNYLDFSVLGKTIILRWFCKFCYTFPLLMKDKTIYVSVKATRVRLQKKEGEDNSEYINANFIKVKKMAVYP